MLEEAEVIAGCVVETVNRHRASTYRQLAVLDDPLNSGIAGAERVLTEAGAASRRPPRLCSNAPALLFSSEARPGVVPRDIDVLPTGPLRPRRRAPEVDVGP